MPEGVLIYDDDCGFCTWWADYFENHTDIRVVGFTNLDPDLRAKLPDDYTNCSHLIIDDTVYSCGASIEQATIRTPLGRPFRPVVEFLRQFRDYERLRERAYRAAANNRSLLGHLMSKQPPARAQD